MADREETKRKRAEARQQRRSQAEQQETNGNAARRERAEDENQPLDTVKHAAKVAAAGAAVGAAAAAARALGHRGEGDDTPDDDSHPEQEPALRENEKPRAERED